VLPEVLALELKFGVDGPPATGSNEAHGFAIGEALLRVFGQLAQLFRQLAKEDQTLFVDGFVRQPAELSGIVVGPAFAMGMPLSRARCGEREAVLRMPWPTCRIQCSYQDTAEAGRTLNLKKRERNLPLSKRSFLQK